MEDEVRRYETIVIASIHIMKAFAFISMLITAIIIVFNLEFNLPKVWNISFLIPMYVVCFASFILNIVCFFRVGAYNKENVRKKNIRLKNLILSTCITYIVYIFIFILYILLSIILFS